MQTEIKSSFLAIKINSFGAEVCSVKNNNGLEFIWQADKAVWARHAPVLFPIVGKLKDSFFLYKNKKYELPQHGFARDMEFTLVEQKENACTFQLIATNETQIKFPFEFIFQITYFVIENKLETHYKVINPSNEKTYFSVGAHPGFNCPIAPNEKPEDYYLEFETNAFSQTKLNNGLRTNEKVPLNLEDKKLFLKKELFDNDALIFEGGQISEISLCSTKSNHKVTLQCPNWPYFGIWMKKGNTQFICLEPWHGIADSNSSINELTKKVGTIELPPKTEFNSHFSLIFS
ncbi:MAG: aldose 1-epimerase family protein [Bacteroidetes bacterium]|nr:aldose 1-epimerase family protein [Bacteroidota bacterium]